MIPRKDDAHSIKNYRPFSLTTTLMKLFEKIISERLKSYLEKKKLLIWKIMEAFSRKEKVCCIYFDIQAAFDKIWHNRLLFKLFKLNIPYYMVIWLRNFL